MDQVKLHFATISSILLLGVPNLLPPFVDHDMAVISRESINPFAAHRQSKFGNLQEENSF